MNSQYKQSNYSGHLKDKDQYKMIYKENQSTEKKSKQQLNSYLFKEIILRNCLKRQYFETDSEGFSFTLNTLSIIPQLVIKREILDKVFEYTNNTEYSVLEGYFPDNYHINVNKLNTSICSGFIFQNISEMNQNKNFLIIPNIQDNNKVSSKEVKALYSKITIKYFEDTLVRFNSNIKDYKSLSIGFSKESRKTSDINNDTNGKKNYNEGNNTNTSYNHINGFILADINSLNNNNNTGNSNFKSTEPSFFSFNKHNKKNDKVPLEYIKNTVNNSNIHIHEELSNISLEEQYQNLYSSLIKKFIDINFIFSLKKSLMFILFPNIEFNYIKITDFKIIHSDISMILANKKDKLDLAKENKRSNEPLFNILYNLNLLRNFASGLISIDKNNRIKTLMDNKDSRKQPILGIWVNLPYEFFNNSSYSNYINDEITIKNECSKIKTKPGKLNISELANIISFYKDYVIERCLNFLLHNNLEEIHSSSPSKNSFNMLVFVSGKPYLFEVSNTIKNELQNKWLVLNIDIKNYFNQISQSSLKNNNKYSNKNKDLVIDNWEELYYNTLYNDSEELFQMEDNNNNYVSDKYYSSMNIKSYYKYLQNITDTSEEKYKLCDSNKNNNKDIEIAFEHDSYNIQSNNESQINVLTTNNRITNITQNSNNNDSLNDILESSSLNRLNKLTNRLNDDTTKFKNDFDILDIESEYSVTNNTNKKYSNFPRQIENQSRITKLISPIDNESNLNETLVLSEKGSSRYNNISSINNYDNNEDMNNIRKHITSNSEYKLNKFINNNNSNSNSNDNNNINNMQIFNKSRISKQDNNSKKNFSSSNNKESLNISSNNPSNQSSINRFSKSKNNNSTSHPQINPNTKILDDKNVMDIIFDQAKNIKLLQEQVLFLQEELQKVKISNMKSNSNINNSTNSSTNNYNKYESNKNNKININRTEDTVNKYNPVNNLINKNSYNTHNTHISNNTNNSNNNSSNNNIEKKLKNTLINKQFTEDITNVSNNDTSRYEIRDLNHLLMKPIVLDQSKMILNDEYIEDKETKRSNDNNKDIKNEIFSEHNESSIQIPRLRYEELNNESKYYKDYEDY